MGSTGLAPDVYPRVNETLVGDKNQDGHFDLGDTASFSALLGGLASAAAVPEPTTLSLAVVLLMGLVIRPRQRV